MTMHHIQTINGNGFSAIEFQAIPQTFQHLQMRISMRSGATSGNGNLYFNFRNNAAQTANGSSHYLFGNGSTVASSNILSLPYGFGTNSIPISTTTANVYASYIIDVLDYRSTSKFKTVRWWGGYDTNGAGQVILGSALIQDLNAVNYCFADTEGSPTSLSTVSLYGITSEPFATGA